VVIILLSVGLEGTEGVLINQQMAGTGIISSTLSSGKVRVQVLRDMLEREEQRIPSHTRRAQTVDPTTYPQADTMKGLHLRVGVLVDEPTIIKKQSHVPGAHGENKTITEYSGQSNSVCGPVSGMIMIWTTTIITTPPWAHLFRCIHHYSAGSYITHVEMISFPRSRLHHGYAQKPQVGTTTATTTYC